MPIDPAKPLRDCPEDQISVSVPRPLNSRLDALVEIANAGGESTNRKEVISALVLGAPEDPDSLAESVRKFRTAQAKDAAVAERDLEDFLDPQPRSPGPRPRRRS